MKRILWLVLVSALLPLLSVLPAFAQAKKVPITFATDTPETIARRAQWIEGAKKEKTLVWWGNLRPNFAMKIIAEFNKIYPFISVNYSRQASEEKATKLEAEFAANRISFDIMEGGGRTNFLKWRKMGVLRKYIDIVPGIERIPKSMYSSAGDTMMAGHQAIVPMYNTRTVSASDAPKSWEDLLDPKWKGHLGITADTKVWALFALAENGWGMEKTERYLKKLGEQKPIWTSGHTAGHMLMVAGEFKIQVEGYLYHALDSIDKGAPVEWVRASPVGITGPAITAMTKAPHMNASNLFLEWLFSPTGLKTYEDATQRGAIFPGAGTRQAELLEGLKLCVRTEEIEKEYTESGILERFAKMIGFRPTY